MLLTRERPACSRGLPPGARRTAPLGLVALRDRDMLLLLGLGRDATGRVLRFDDATRKGAGPSWCSPASALLARVVAPSALVALRDLLWWPCVTATCVYFLGLDAIQRATFAATTMQLAKRQKPVKA
eukprot:TRINITY_DN2538_c0_g1_i1.p3 TRINITY_DN2538_c0_g1~~TRINITY_DN2538_c0_g1_i1.p3  ORF type:complete len:127 (+),score=1.54 TRINITY_DN2538_c0_g1_i1:606-986(+)